MPYRPKNPQAQPPAPAAKSSEPQETPANPTGLNAVSKPRKTIWIVGLCVALYMIISGLWQAFFTTQS